MNEHEVFLIVDPAFLGDLWSLSRDAHVWIVSSSSNDAAAGAVWKREAAGTSPLSGVTTFRGMRGRPETVYALLETIESHHGQYAAAPAWGSIHIVGVNLDSVSIDRIADGLGLASVRLEAESDGFVIRRAAHTHAAADGGRAHGDE